MKSVLYGLIFVTFASFGDDTLSFLSIKQATESQEYEKLKAAYRICVIEKGRRYATVSEVDSAIKYAPIACKRELLFIKQFLLAGAFQIEVINQLIRSVEDGVNIDLVIQVYDTKLNKQPSIRNH